MRQRTLSVLAGFGSRVVAMLGVFVVLAALAPRAAAQVDFCAGGTLGPGNASTDLVVQAPCYVSGASPAYTYRYVYVVQGGVLLFLDHTAQFYAGSILVQNGGALGAWVGRNHTLTIHLYGSPGDQPIGCIKTPAGPTLVSDSTCGVPAAIWASNTMGTINPASCVKSLLPNGVNDCFYQYMDMGDGYFGKKVLAVAYGGRLFLSGAKGTLAGIDADPSNSGASWARLDATLLGGEVSLKLDRAVDWRSGDRIVVTSTDYLPGHAEQLTVQSAVLNPDGTSTLQLAAPAQWPHNGFRYDYSTVPATFGPDQDPRLPLGKRLVETRAAVGLLTRSIRIVSDGATPGTPLPPAPGNYFGGHTMFRQGFGTISVHGVEFYQLGQGGSKGHYPVHFHLTRRVPDGTEVADSSIWDSMTRWVTLHGTQGVTLRRNVGYLSIGHGFYLEDGTETDNRLLTNLGVFARAAVQNPQNPRSVPGILARHKPADDENPPYYSDVDHPTVFWIMNGWNDFQYNMAAGAGTCGVCYWLLPGGISGLSQQQKWESYAGQQRVSEGRSGYSPLRSFVGNSCSTAMNSLLNVGSTSPCLGVADNNDNQHLLPVPNPVADSAPADYWPALTGQRNPTQCLGTDCSTNVVDPPCNGTKSALTNCVVTAVDHYTTSFNWAQKNFSAIWLRPWWFLVTNSAVTDVQEGGLTFVTSGGYTRSDVAIGYWSLVDRSIFVGNTQPNGASGFPANPFASNGGPFNPASGLTCDYRRGDYCLSVDEGVSYPFEILGLNQRLFNIYDGPAFQSRNVYRDITPTQLGPLTDCKDASNPAGPCNNSFQWMYGREIGVPMQAGSCYLPNAAIGWKQSNGFYYPPAFHSDQLYFENVAIRHFVIEPLFQQAATWSYNPGSPYYKTDASNTGVPASYCTWNDAMFNNYTDIDRQTELSDDDGSLTGLLGPARRDTISVNQDDFFHAPKVTVECASDQHPAGVAATLPPGTADTSPYEYVSTAMIADCGVVGGPLTACPTQWSQDCGNERCYGVPLYRQYLTPTESQNGQRPMIRMAGQGTGQRSTLTVNHGKYYIDTQVSAQAQIDAGAKLFNVFQGGHTYYVWFLYAKPTTHQTYQLYVGKGLSPATVTAGIKPYRVNIDTQTYRFSASSGAQYLTSSYDPASGLATIDVNLSQTASEFATDKQQFCGPQTYCSWSTTTNSCGCAPCTDPTRGCRRGVDCTAATANACSWGPKEIDCPLGGCFGFGVTLPSSFTAAGVAPPAPGLFTDDPDYSNDWGVPWTLVSSSVSGQQCHYSSAPQ